MQFMVMRLHRKRKTKGTKATATWPCYFVTQQHCAHSGKITISKIDKKKNNPTHKPDYPDPVKCR
jgi:hypothetical protein